MVFGYARSSVFYYVRNRVFYYVRSSACAAVATCSIRPQVTRICSWGPQGAVGIVALGLCSP